MYAALAHDGDFRDVHLLRGGWERIPIVSAGAAWLTRRALRKRDRPGFDRRRINPDAARIWWKTGTSYGHRDAWAAGGGPHFTAVAWMGNLDHRRSAALVGAGRAGPLLFDVLEAIEYDDDGLRDRRPDDLAEVEVCAYSGRLPDAACDHTTTVWAPRSRVPTEHCPYHVRVAIDDETGEALAPACRAGREYTEKSFVVWPATVRRFMTDRRRAGPRVPPLAEGCGEYASQKPPKIVSPPRDQTLVLMPDVSPTDQEIPLEAESDFAGAQLSWFVNGEFLGSSDADGRVWWTPSPGTHELVVTDAAGHAARRVVEVR
jgi:penicillin-binding protein 1C